METLISILRSTYQSMSETVMGWAPQLGATFVIIVAGLIVARAAKAGVFALLERLKLDDFSSRVGASDALQRGEVGESTSQIVATLVYWAFLVFAAAAALNVWGVADVGTFAAVGHMIPGVVIAAAILVLGLNVSAFISKMIQTAAVNAEVRQARLVRNVAHYGMSSLVVVLALRHLGVPQSVLADGFLILFASTCAAFALAFGLGCRELAGSVAKSAYKRERAQAQSLAEASQLGTQLAPKIVVSTRKPRRARATA